MPAPRPSPAPLRAGPRQWAGLAILTLPALLLSLDSTVLFLALPHLSAALDVTSTESLWIMDIYGFLIAGSLITMGTLGDRIGRRRLLLIGGAAFGVASVLAAYSATPEMLIATRALLGVAGATLMPSTMALIMTMFPDARQRGTAIGIWVSCFSLGIAIGPVLGGLMLEYFWWGSVFLLAVPVMVLMLALGPVLLPEARGEEAGRLDLPSVALSLAAMIPAIYGIKDLAKSGVSVLALASVLVGVAIAVVFVRRQFRLTSPLLDLRLFASRRFTAALVIVLVGLLALGGVYLFVTQYLQLVRELSPLVAGMWLLPAALSMVVSSMVAPALAQRLRPGMVVGAGLLLSAAGCLLLTAVSVDGLPLLVVGFTLFYLGIGPMVTLGNELIVGSAPPDKAGSASAVGETAMEIGMALGIAVLGSLGTAVYQARVAGEEFAGASEAAARAAHDSLAAGASAAGPLPEAAALLAPAREAFTGALNLVGLTGGLIVALLVVVAVVSLREVPPTGSGQEEARGDADAAGGPAEAAATPV
ncbi:MFS transporter [Streptomyces sp. NPDC055254]